MKFFDRLFQAADKYMKKCKWTDLALLKFCLCAIGIIIGLNVSKNKKKSVQTCAGIVFAATYIPLMAKFIPILIGEFKNSED